MCILVNLCWHLLMLKELAAWAYLMLLDGNCGKSGQTNLIFYMMLPVDEVLCMPGQYRVFPPLAAVIAARLRGKLATRHCWRSIGISAHVSSRAWRSSPRIWGGLSILVIARPIISQTCSMGWQSGDLAGCSILVTLPCWRNYPNMLRCGVSVLVVVVIPGLLSWKRH